MHTGQPNLPCLFTLRRVERGARQRHASPPKRDTQIYYHIVFATKHRCPVLEAERRPDLFRYIWGILQNKKCHPYRVNGVEDHLHIFTSLHPALSMAGLIKEIKNSTNSWIKSDQVFPRFSHWQEGYSAFTHSHEEKNRLIDYVKNQESHHQKVSFLDEIRRLLEASGVDYDEKYLI